MRPKRCGVVEPRDYAIFQNHGYQGLYGGMTAQDIHIRKGLKKGQQILDHMGSTELAANLFRATQTEESFDVTKWSVKQRRTRRTLTKLAKKSGRRSKSWAERCRSNFRWPKASKRLSRESRRELQSDE